MSRNIALRSAAVADIENPVTMPHTHLFEFQS
jgi:hypothetical protein